MSSNNGSPAAAFTVAAVARRIGVAPGTLRTWSRRYGIGPTGHSEGEHRKYSEEDLAKLIYMRKLIISGVSPLDASRKALEHKGRAFLNETELQVVRDDELVEQLYRAARGLDCELLESRIRTHLEKNSIESTWHGLLVPLLILVGDEWKESGTGIEVERLLSEVILRIFNSKITVVDSKSSTRPVLIASIGEETHSLAITALAAALSERGIAVQFLGARTPKSAINEVVRRSAPAAIFLWAQLRKHADASFITDLPSIRPKPKVIIGGPGWGVKHYAEFHRAADLSAACSHIERAVGL